MAVASTELSVGTLAPGGGVNDRLTDILGFMPPRPPVMTDNVLLMMCAMMCYFTTGTIYYGHF